MSARAARRIDWYYHRANCDACAASQSFLNQRGLAIGEQVDARKVRFDRSAALKLARAAARVISIRGRTQTVFEMQRQPPDDVALAKAILGPKGNLRAPSMRIGATLLVGFDEGAVAAQL